MVRGSICTRSVLTLYFIARCTPEEYPARSPSLQVAVPCTARRLTVRRSDLQSLQAKQPAAVCAADGYPDRADERYPQVHIEPGRGALRISASDAPGLSLTWTHGNSFGRPGGCHRYFRAQKSVSRKRLNGQVIPIGFRLRVMNSLSLGKPCVDL